MTQIQTKPMQPWAASLAVALCGAVWGVYWLPLRYLESVGLSGSWATAAFFAVALPPAVLLAVLARREICAQLRTFLSLALLNGLVFNLYSNAYTATTVFNVLFLFYLSPIWSILIARFWFREPVSAVRFGCVVAGLAGLVIMLSGGGDWPVPRNLGDWMALASGVLWALVAIRIRNSPEFGTASNSVAFFLGGLILAVIFAMLLGSNQVPTAETIHAAWPLVLFVAYVAWLPSQFLLFWGVRRISPVRTGLLLMTELVSGVVTAAWLSGDRITWLQALGGALILAAGLGDVLISRERARAAPIPAAIAQE
ncbi:MAG TPA: DMT family transporter [Dongiaceae bacterium]|nr:DMT family transporter [Dongiaceae bacterium]